MLDVFVNEPLPSAHAFWRHPRVTITPHIAAVTLPEQAMDQVSANLLRLEAGEQPADWLIFSVAIDAFPNPLTCR
ncbi:Glyoxylate/hydroxypyruvate reductase A [Serratia fonticola]|uniref:Glyoxylate/hydroxypyruvate reductase A n=1 Tax=Serratia fonticola TaxID=47917 RepID=A0A4U9TEZ3_SERFO|nr:Glyoxylate/hydroxypyruvate reductase A [Serratia fonticola]